MIDHSERILARVRHIADAIAIVRSALVGETFETIRRKKLVWAGLQRYLEVISEATRHIPDDWKLSHGPNVAWRNIADLGNHLRHEYHRTDDEILWRIYSDDLDSLEAAIISMLANPGPNPSPPSP